jgi:hypothetical protein
MRHLTMLSMLAALAVAGFIAGCESGPSATERDYGSSKRQVFASQVNDPVAGTTDSTAPPPSPDNDAVNAAMGKMRKEGGTRSEVGTPIVINTGSGPR